MSYRQEACCVDDESNHEDVATLAGKRRRTACLTTNAPSGSAVEASTLDYRGPTGRRLDVKPCNQVVADEKVLNHANVQAMLSIAIASVSAKKILEDLSNRKEFQMKNITKKNEGLLKQAFGFDCGEVYSPPRITKMASEMGLHPAWALDLTVIDA